MGISKELTEEDVKFRYINEAITSKGWSKDSIFMEQKVKFTDGKISLHGNLVHREKPKFADYVLYANKATPIAIVDMDDVDDFDFICHIAYGKKTLTRYERAEQVKKRDIFSKYGEQARLVLEALLDKYTKEGVSELESLTVLENDPFRKLGSKANIVKFFGGKQGYLDAVKELEQNIYSIA